MLHLEFFSFARKSVTSFHWLWEDELGDASKCEVFNLFNCGQRVFFAKNVCIIKVTSYT